MGLFDMIHERQQKVRLKKAKERETEITRLRTQREALHKEREELHELAVENKKLEEEKMIVKQLRQDTSKVRGFLKKVSSITEDKEPSGKKRGIFAMENDNEQPRVFDNLSKIGGMK